MAPSIGEWSLNARGAGSGGDRAACCLTFSLVILFSLSADVENNQ